MHFEMGYQDKQRMADFYGKVFGWQMQIMGPEMGNYVVVTTSKSDEKTGRPKQPGTINGGFYQKTENPLSHAPSIVIGVDNIKQAVEDTKAAGGKILGAMDSSGQHSDKPQEIPGVGLWISAMDTEGNRFSILQPKGM